MSLWDFVRGPASVRLLLDFGAERGLPEARLLKGSRLSAAQLADPHAELSTLQELRVIENLLSALGHPPGLGLEVGLRYRFSTFGFLGYGLVSSPTLGDALAMALRFIPVTFSYAVVDRHLHGDHVVLTYGPPDLPPGLRRFTVECDMAVAAGLGRELGGPGFELSSFNLQRGHGRLYARPATVQPIFGVMPRYDADGYSLSFHRRYLARKLPNANPTTAALCEQLCAQLLEKRRARLGTARLIQEYLVASASRTLPSLANLARLTNTSERTLKRHLQQEGTSFRALVTESRSAAAAELVRDPHLSLTEVADRLGYADLSSFSQAFKRWHGVPPAAFRRAQAR